MSSLISDFNLFLNELIFPFFTAFFNWLNDSLIGKIFIFSILISLFTFLIIGFLSKERN